MDMQPITAPSLERPGGGNKGKRRVAYAKPSSKETTYLSGSSTTNAKGIDAASGQPPTLYRGTSGGGSSCDVLDSSHSPSKFPLLGSNHSSKGKSATTSSSSSRGGQPTKTKRQSKRSSGFKLSRALFRDRDPNGFSKMDFVASDATGNHKKRHSKQRVKNNNNHTDTTLALSPLEEQLSFDASSNTSDHVVDDEPFTSAKEKQEQLKQTNKKSPGILLNKRGTQPKCVLEMDRVQEATFSTEISDASFVSSNNNGPEPSKAAATATAKATEKASFSVNNTKGSGKGKSSPLSVPQPAKAPATPTPTPTVTAKPTVTSTPTDETADPVTDYNIPSDVEEKILARFNLSACSPTPLSIETKSVPCQKTNMTQKGSSAFVTPTTLAATGNNNKGANNPSSEPSAIPTTSTSSITDEPPKLTSAKNVSAKKIQPLKPPPALPPKVPRKQYLTSEQQQQKQQQQQQQQVLRNHQQRLLQGGEFLNESTGSAAAAGNKDNNTNMGLKILERLQKTNPEQLMTEHYNQDPPIAVMNDQSGNESSGTNTPVHTPARRQNNNNSNNNSSNSYMALVTDSDRSGSTAGGGVEECKINYMYSQDNDFENSILSPSICNQKAKNNGRGRPFPAENRRQRSPVSPSRYRSDAINAFIERAQCPSECSVARELKYDTLSEEHGNKAIIDEDDDNDDHVAEEGPNLVSDEFLNMVTSGCTGGVGNPEAKRAIKEKFVALEAGWSGLRSQINDRVNDLEESWKNWNLNSLLQFASPNKEETTSMASPTVQTTRSAEIPSNVWEMSREETVTPIQMFAEEQVECTFDGRRAQPMNEECNQVTPHGMAWKKYRRYDDRFANPGIDNCNAIEKIEIGSTEHDVPMSLKDTLADISGIEDGNDGPTGSSATKQKYLDSSREDSEGGKVILDAAEWDPVETSDLEDVGVEHSADTGAIKGNYYIHSTSGKVLKSPTSVLAEI